MTSLPPVRNPAMLLRPCLFGGKFHCQLRLTKQTENLNTTKYRVNLCDQQRKKEQDDWEWEKQMDCLTGATSQTSAES